MVPGAHPIAEAAIAGLVTWAATAFGAAMVFLRREPSRAWLDAMLGFAAGVMLAAAYWSLLAPALALGEAGPLPAWMPATMGFLLGGAALWGLDKVLPHLHIGAARAEGPATGLRRTTLLVVALTIHNLPEGLAIGVAVGAAAQTGPEGAAVALIVGLAVQNIPEGFAVSVPLRREGLTARRSFFWGQLSGVVEPIGAVIGAAITTASASLLPYALGFAAGAMVFVVVEELIPESQRGGDTDGPTVGALLGFALMMVLDTSLA